MTSGVTAFAVDGAGFVVAEEQFSVGNESLSELVQFARARTQGLSLKMALRASPWTKLAP